MEPITYFVYGADVRETIPGVLAYFERPMGAFQNHGAVVLEEEEFAKIALCDKLVRPCDKMVNFFIADVNAKLLYDVVTPENRWTYLIDERAHGDGTHAYEGRLEHFQKFNVHQTILTYSNREHLDVLTKANIKYVVMPTTTPSKRSRTQKDKRIIVSGTHGPAYPVRTRLSFVLQNAGVKGTDVLENGVVSGEEYYDHLDRYELGIVCRGGFRDRLVAKYLELGACHVLPVGDCPTYMPEDMKRLMLDTSTRWDDGNVKEVLRLLASPEELQKRQDEYAELCHKYFDADEHAKRVLSFINA